MCSALCATLELLDPSLPLADATDLSDHPEQPQLDNAKHAARTHAHPFGVIFDMDGVLVDSAAPHLESWRRLARDNGCDVTPEQFAATFGRQNKDIIPLLFGSMSESRLRTMSDRKEEIYRQLVRGRVSVVAGAAELVRTLHMAGARLAIGSSGPRTNIDLVLAEMGVAGLFSTIVSADDVTRGKPDPQVFAIACERLGLPPDRCVVIEDAPAGVTAAKAAGCRAVAVLMHHPAQCFIDADLVIDRLSCVAISRLLGLVKAAPRSFD